MSDYVVQYDADGIPDIEAEAEARGMSPADVEDEYRQDDMLQRYEAGLDR